MCSNKILAVVLQNRCSILSTENRTPKTRDSCSWPPATQHPPKSHLVTGHYFSELTLHSRHVKLSHSRQMPPTLEDERSSTQVYTITRLGVVRMQESWTLTPNTRLFSSLFQVRILFSFGHCSLSAPLELCYTSCFDCVVAKTLSTHTAWLIYSLDLSQLPF